MATKFKSKLFYGKSGFFDSLSIGNENSSYAGLYISGKDVKIENSQVSFDSRPSVNGSGILLQGEVYDNATFTQASFEGATTFDERPLINGTGILLEGEVQSNTIISGVVYSAQINVKNAEDFTIYKGQPVYIKSAQGGNILIGLASNSGESTSSKTLGLVVQDSLAHNASGTVITDGLLENFNTSSASAGDPIWLGLTGNLLYGLANKPHAPNHMVYLGVVTRAQNNGEVFVKVQNGYELDELHDLNTTLSQSGQFLFKNNNVWEGKFLGIHSVSGLQNSLNEKQVTGDYYLSSNPSGFITGIDTSSFYTNDNPSGFITGIDTSSFYTNDNPSGFITGVDTSNFYTNDNPSGFITGVDTSNFYTNDNPSGFITGVDLSSYVTSSQTGEFYPASNPNGFITGVDLSSYVTSSQTGEFYPASNPNGFITGVDMSNFYTNNNPSGFITGVNLSSYVTNSQTGEFYPASNPSGFLTAALAASGYVTSNITNISGATTLTNLIQITQSGYNAIASPEIGTLYIIVG